MKVLRIWHAAVVTEYRKKVRALAGYPEVDLTLLIPRAWKEGGKEIRYEFNDKIDSGFSTVTGHIIRQNNIRRYVFLTGLWKTLRKIRPDIIDLEEEPYSYIARQILFFCNRLRLKSKIIFHSSTNTNKKPGNPFVKIQEKTFSLSSAAIVRNKETKAYLQNNGFEKPIFLSGNGIDCNHFSPGESNELHKKFNLIGKKIIGFVGKLRTGKGIHTLLEAFKELPANTMLLLIGEGHLYGEIRDIAKNGGYYERVILAGHIDHWNLPKYYRLMDVFVIPSQTQQNWKESFGRVIIEAMACGVPVIGSSSGAIPEIIAEAGIIFPEKDASGLGKEINKLIQDTNLLERYKKAGLNRAMEFSWEAIAEINYEAYQSVLNM